MIRDNIISIEEVEDELNYMSLQYKLKRSLVKYKRKNQKGLWVDIEGGVRGVETIDAIKKKNVELLNRIINYLGEHTFHYGHSERLDKLKDLAWKHLNIFGNYPKEHFYS